MTSSQSHTKHSGQPGVRVDVVGRTDVGKVRDHNEDNLLLADLTAARRLDGAPCSVSLGERGMVFAVCDGMGGAAAGEVASQLAVDTIYEVLGETTADPGDALAWAQQLNRAVCEAGRRIFAAAKENASRRGMGTTATVAVAVGGRLLFGQVGDSRAYVLRNGDMVQTTKDQSLVQQLIDAKQLTEEEAKHFDRSNIILQALGTSEAVHVDVTSIEIRRGDVLLLCSDGLSGLVDSAVISDVLRSTDDLDAAAERLIALACDAGGDDNVTVVLARFDGEGLPDTGDGPAVSYQRFYDPVADALIGPPADAAPPPPPQSPITRRSVRWAVGLLAVLGAALAVGWWQWKAHRSPDPAVVPGAAAFSGGMSVTSDAARDTGGREADSPPGTDADRAAIGGAASVVEKVDAAAATDALDGGSEADTAVSALDSSATAAAETDADTETEGGNTDGGSPRYQRMRKRRAAADTAALGVDNASRVSGADTSEGTRDSQTSETTAAGHPSVGVNPY